MSGQLVVVQKVGGDAKGFMLDPAHHLSAVRKTLEAKQFMDESDAFLHANAPVERSDEGRVPLSALIGDGDGGELHIGESKPDLGPDADGLVRYDALSDTQKLALLSGTNVAVYSGLTASTKGFAPSFKPALAPWHAADLPNARAPRIITEVSTDTAFSEVEKSLSETSTDKASLDLTTPYGGGEASYEYAKTHSESSDEVTEYLVGKYIVRKVSLQVEQSALQLTADFERAVVAAAKASSDIDGIAAVIDVLNARGWYVPAELTLGGAVFTSSSTKISKFSESDSEKTDFSVGFKLAFDSIGGGASYSHAEGRDTSTSTTSKFTSLSFDQIGGQPAPNDDQFVTKWIESLKSALNWGVASYDRLVPTVGLLTTPRLAVWITQMLDRYSTYESVASRQTVIDLASYSTSVQTMLSKSAA